MSGLCLMGSREGYICCVYTSSRAVEPGRQPCLYNAHVLTLRSGLPAALVGWHDALCLSTHAHMAGVHFAARTGTTYACVVWQLIRYPSSRWYAASPRSRGLRAVRPVQATVPGVTLETGDCSGTLYHCSVSKLLPIPSAITLFVLVCVGALNNHLTCVDGVPELVKQP